MKRKLKRTLQTLGFAVWLPIGVIALGLMWLEEYHPFWYMALTGAVALCVAIATNLYLHGL